MAHPLSLPGFARLPECCTPYGPLSCQSSQAHDCCELTCLHASTERQVRTILHNCPPPSPVFQNRDNPRLHNISEALLPPFPWCLGACLGGATNANTVLLQGWSHTQAADPAHAHCSTDTHSLQTADHNQRAFITNKAAATTQHPPHLHGTAGSSATLDCQQTSNTKGWNIQKPLHHTICIQNMASHFVTALSISYVTTKAKRQVTTCQRTPDEVDFN